MYRCQVCGHPLAPGETACTQCGRAYFGAVCPACHQPAPTIVRGGRSVCTGCGAVRGIFSGVPLNVVGSAHRVGSVVGSVLSVGFMLGALALGALVGLLVGVLTTGLAGVLVALAVTLIGALVGSLGLFGSRQLADRGKAVRDDAFNQSILAMAARRGGAVTTVEVAQNLGIALPDADRVLGEMIGRGLGTVEVNHEGLLQYAFRDVRPVPLGGVSGGVSGGAAGGVSGMVGGRTGVRVDPTLVAPPHPDAAPADIARDRVDREFQAMTDRRRTGGL